MSLGETSITCVVCDGDGGHEASCKGCVGSGHQAIDGCPWRWLTADVWLVVEAAGRASRRGGGVWPVAGGWMDQTAIGLQAIELVWSEERMLKSARSRDGQETD